MKKYRVWYSTIYGIAFELRKGENKRDIISNLPKYLKKYIEIEAL